MKKILGFMGIDHAVAYSLVGRSWNLLSNIVMMLFVARFLSPGEQGFYYTFSSLVAMQILFELGMSVVVTQFSSHEMANLSWSDADVLIGDAGAKNRLRTLILMVGKWYGVIALLLLVVVFPVGWSFFSHEYTVGNASWHLAWLWLVVATAINIAFLPLLSVLEGCGRVSEISLLRLRQNILGSILAWATLAAGGGLLALPVMSTSAALVGIVWLYLSKKTFLLNLLKLKSSSSSLNWRREIWPFQWKIALSWLSGYFIFQLFTPVMFAYHGAISAGQMGMSLSVANALIAIAITWINAKSPGFGTLVAKNDYSTLDRVFFLTFSRSLSVMILIGMVLSIGNYFLHTKGSQISSRLLDPLPFSFLMLASVFAYVTYAQATYLRAHKEEPFMVISIISALLIGGLTVMLGKDYGAMGLMLSYASVYAIVGVGWGSKIFFGRRREWQNSNLN
jgi:O-antigen/teichoic acid export membrane protein